VRGNRPDHARLPRQPQPGGPGTGHRPLDAEAQDQGVRDRVEGLRRSASEPRSSEGDLLEIRCLPREPVAGVEDFVDYPRLRDQEHIVDLEAVLAAGVRDSNTAPTPASTTAAIATLLEKQRGPQAAHPSRAETEVEVEHRITVRLVG